MGKSLLQEQIEEIIESYYIYKGNALEASKSLSYSYSTIIRYWKKNKLKAVGKGLVDSDKEKLPELFKKNEGNLEKIAQELGCSKFLVYNGLKEFKINLLEKYRGYDTALDYFLVNKEKYSGMSRRELAFSDSGLYGVLLARGYLDEAIPEKKPKGKKKISGEKIEKIIESYDSYKGNANEVARLFSYSPTTIARYWKKAGLKSKGKVGRKKLHKKY